MHIKRFRLGLGNLTGHIWFSASTSIRKFYLPTDLNVKVKIT